MACTRHWVTRPFTKELRDYFTQYGGGSASDAQFIAVMEQTSGRELDDFFERWFK